METKMKYCLNCGTQLPEKAKFCVACGEEQVTIAPALEKPASDTAKQGPPQPPPASEKAQGKSEQYPTLSLHTLEPGAEFHGYTIIRLMNKDSEGMKYIASKNNQEYIIKVFHKSRYMDINKMLNQQMLLSRINLLDSEHIAKVEEINQSHNEAFLATRFVQGTSLDKLKKQNSQRITEDFVRDVAIQLIKTTMIIRKHGLSVNKLLLSSMMIDDAGKLVILSSGITYDDTDEREDIHTIGAILAQLLSKHTLSQSLYRPERLLEVKFQYLHDVTNSFNKILAMCLHRNILHRATSLQQVLDSLQKMPAYDENDLWREQEKHTLGMDELEREIIKPRLGVEWGFVALVVVVLLLTALFLFTNIFSIIFRRSDKPFTFSGFTSSDTLKTDTAQSNHRVGGEVSPSQTEYGMLKSAQRQSLQGQPLDRLNIGTSTAGKTAKPAVKQAPMPDYMVHIPAGSFGFGRLKENLNHNVSQNGFYISKYELTQKEWVKYMKPAAVSLAGDNLPVENISWESIITYCNGRSKAEGLDPAYRIEFKGKERIISCNFNANGWRLPTEAEWEMAAKAGALFEYSGSDNHNDISWNRDNSPARIQPVGKKNANTFGLFDMTGNVSEWCWDWYDANYIRAQQRFINPSGPDTGSQRVIRGGNVMNGEGRNLNILYRDKGNPNRGIPYVGFRLVRSR